MLHPLDSILGALALVLFLAPPRGAQTVGTFSLPASLADPAAAVRWSHPVPAFCEGPAWQGGGTLWFTEQHGKDTANWPIWRMKVGGADPGASVHLSSSNQANGLAVDPGGRLVACQRRRVSRLHEGGPAQVLADSTADLPFSFANDLTFASDGSFYFTALDSLVYHVGADGKTSVAARGLRGANGILLTEEDGTLYVGDADAGQVLRYRVGRDGSLRDPAVHLRMARPDGMCMDARGNLYVADISQGRVRVFSPAGDSLGHVALDPPPPWNGYKRGVNGNASNCEFGGEDGRTLFITGDGGLYAFNMKVAGRVLPLPVGILRSVPEGRTGRFGGRIDGWSDRISGIAGFVLRASTVAGRLHGPVLLGRRTAPLRPAPLLPGHRPASP